MKLLRILCPAEYVQSITDIDLKLLKDRGIDTILVDLDNTLVPWRSFEIKPEIKRWVGEAKKQGMKLCIVSNTRNIRRLHELASELRIPYVCSVLKPRRRGFLAALDLLDGIPERSVVIGDQIFTDILGGNRLKLHTILVSPLQQKEFIGTRISRVFERYVLKFFERQGMIQKPGAAVAREQTSTPNRQIGME